MPYQRIVSTLGCPERSLGEVAALAAEHGLAAVELRALGGSLDLPAYLAQIYGTPDRLWIEAKRMGLNVAVLSTSLKLAGSGEPDRTAFLTFVPWAEALGVRWLRVFDGSAPCPEATLTESLATLAWWRGRRRAHGWKCDMLVETHDSFLTAEAIHRFAAAAGSPAIRWDAHHTWKKGGEDPLVTWQGIRTHVVAIDVKDSVSRPSERHPFTYVLPGTGEFPMAPLRAKLAVEYDGLLSLEWERHWHPYLPPIEEALQSARDRGWW